MEKIVCIHIGDRKDKEEACNCGQELVWTISSGLDNEEGMKAVDPYDPPAKLRDCASGKYLIRTETNAEVEYMLKESLEGVAGTM